MTDVATTWLEGLAARGIAVTVRGNKLVAHPASSYKDLTDAELIVLRHHRAEIKARLQAGITLEVRSAPVSTPPTPTPPPATPCRWCGCTPCIGETHRRFYDLHPIERQRRDDELATATMKAAIRRRNAQ